MSKILKPTRLDLDHNAPTASKEWKHWKQTFENFIEDFGEDAPDKFRSIINFVSSNVYDYIEECDSYERIIKTLEKLYIKAPNEVFARHQLLIRHQTSAKTVTRELYREKQIRDLFISEITSNYIRQRLLENSTLNLQSAFNQARSLDIAQRNSESYIQKPLSLSTSPNIGAIIKLPEESSAALNAMPVHPQTNCIYCGNQPHNQLNQTSARKNCLAQNVTCFKCGKKGHFSKVCLGWTIKKTHSVTAAVHKSSLCTVLSGCPESLFHTSVVVKINGESLTALIDSCISDNFISKKIIDTLKIETLPSKRKISMALTKTESGLVGCCSVNLELNGLLYNNVQFGILENLCNDIILGYDFQKQHKNLIFPWWRKRRLNSHKEK
ncbi:uncharacterized protein LOC136082565 [Hydra vulgaris]|uniref:Uncharacterized protein LOC136082565 n=1 Tax=Hydra vulgaris TaxID=6087 RepID=A0ABM4C8V6_HYDVU